MNAIPGTVILVTNTVICLLLAWFVLSIRKAPGHTFFSLLLISAAIWSGGYAIEALSPDLAGKLLASKFEYIGIVFLPVTWLLFTLYYTKPDRTLHVRWVYLLCVLIPLIILLLVWTNEYHRLLWVQFSMPAPGEFPEIKALNGPWFWVVPAYGYAILVAGVVILISSLREKRDRLSRWQIYLVLLAISIPWIADLIHILSPSLAPGPDWTMLAFILTAVIISIDIFLFNWLRFVPIAYIHILKSMSDPVIVLDARDRIVDINPAAESLFNVKAGAPVSALYLSNLGSQLTEYFLPDTNFSCKLEDSNGSRYFDVRVSRLSSGTFGNVGSLVMMYDITREKAHQEDLENKQKALEKVVAERTQELEKANILLSSELALRRQAEDRYRLLFEDAPVMYIVVVLEQEKQVIVDCNQMFLKTLGYEKSEVIGCALFDFYSPESQTQFITTDSSLNSGAYLSMLDRQLVTREGGIIDTLAQAILETNAAGQVTAARNMYLDITERKVAENKLQRQAAQRQILLEASLDMSSILDEDAIIDRTFASIQELVGYDYGILCMVDEQSGLLKPVRMLNCESYINVLEERLQEPAQTLIGTIFLDGQGRLINNAHLDTHMHYPSENNPVAEHVICLPIQVHEQKIGVLRVSRYSPEYTRDDFELIQLFINLAGISLQNARLFNAVQRQVTAIRRQQSDLRRINARLQDVQELERKQLATALHDRVGQNLTALSVNVNIVQRMIQNGQLDQIDARLKDTSDLLAETTRQVRDVLSDLRPPALDDYGLYAALRLYGQTVHLRTGLEFICIGKEPEPRLPVEVENALFRIAQEAITNILKHAQASRVIISLEPKGETLCLKIHDNGKGFPDPASRKEDDVPHYGLVTMRERALTIGAETRIESVRGQGTSVEILFQRGP